MKYLIEKLNSLTSDQKELFNQMQENNKLQICIPTGAGKGYLMIVDLLNQIKTTKSNIFAISTHRLMLNTQHLNDIFDTLKNEIGNIGYIFVGSSKYDISKFLDNPSLNKALLDKNLSYDEIISSTTSTKEVDELVNEHISKGRKVVIMTTYHSLDKLKNLNIRTLYCDESHTLASESETAKFKENFNKIKSDRIFFFTATPKDCTEDTEAFLMNNEDVFGKRVGLTFRQCIESGYIVKPVIHIAMPENYVGEGDLKSINNMGKFIIDTYSAHTKFIEENSVDVNKITPKILVKCPSVDEMWYLHKNLIGKIGGVKICAGASRNNLSTINHFIDNEGIVSRAEYLERLQSLDDCEGAIVLHFDTLSEGINVSGFTGVEFLGGKLPTITKTLQNTGRSTRLHKEDRNKFRMGEISVGDGNWIKPYCAVIIPYWDKESEFTTRELARQIRELRDNFGYDPIFYVSIGDDLGKGEKKPDIEALNKTGDKSKKTVVIENIINEIEVMDKEVAENKELERLKNMEFDEWFKFING